MGDKYGSALELAQIATPADPDANYTKVYAKSDGKVYAKNGATETLVGPAAGGGSGDVVGPASAVNNNLAAFNTTTGKLIKDSGLKTGTASGDIPVLGASGVLAIGRLATGTPDGTKFVRDDGTLATPAGGGSSLLAYVVRTATSNSTYTIASTTNTDVDATNLAITFTVPASGNVLIRLSGAVGLVADAGGGTARCYWSLRLSTTNVAGSERLMQTAALSTTAPTCHLSAPILLTGLTPGASVTYKWAWRSAVGDTATLYYGNGTSTAAEFGTALTNNGALTMEAWSA